MPRRHLLLPTAAEVGKNAASLSRWTPLLHQRAYEIPTSRISYGAVRLLTYLFSPKNHGRKKGIRYRICSRYQKAFECASFRICFPLYANVSLKRKLFYRILIPVLQIIIAKKKGMIHSPLFVAMIIIFLVSKIRQNLYQ